MTGTLELAYPTPSAEQNRLESEEQLSLLQSITRELAAAGDLLSALRIVLRRVCEKTGWALGQAWIPNNDLSALTCEAAWFGHERGLEDFRHASELAQFRRGVGLPGRVWESKEPAWVEDVTSDPNFPRSKAARASGLKTGVGIPILGGNKVIAVLEFFMRGSYEQNERSLNFITSVAGQLDLLRRATDAEASARERQFRTLANSISQLAWMADGEGYIFWYNDRWFDYTGTTLEQMQGWGWQKVHHPDEVARVVARIKIAFATGEPWEDTFPLRSKTGEYRWFLSRALPIFDPDGKVARWFGTNTDITEQRQVELALRENERQFGRWRIPYRNLPGWRIVRVASFGTTTAGTIIAAPPLKRCRAGAGKRCITRTKSTVSSRASRLPSPRASHGKIRFHCAISTASIDGSYLVLFPSRIEKARSFVGSAPIPTLPSNGNWSRRCARVGMNWSKR
jgi:PAS domain S-box-containing protein